MSDLTAKKKLTPKERVLLKYPAAFSYRWIGSTSIYRPLMGGNMNVGDGPNAVIAWANALKNIRSGKA